MKYTSAAAFRQALEQRLKNEAASTGLGLARLRKRVAFELFLRRLLIVAPDRWVLKGALALNFRLAIATRTTKDIDLGRDDDEQSAIRDITTAQQLALDDHFTFAAMRTYELEDTDEFSAVRFHVTAQLAGRTFEQFLIDIGFSDTISWTPDTIHTSQSLSFAGIAPLAIPAIPIPQHLAEKVHAYTRTYGETKQPSTRPKDLIDILLIESTATIQADALHHALQSTFAERAHQPLPISLPPPPTTWTNPYKRLAVTVRIESDLHAAYTRAAAFLDPVLAGHTHGLWDPQRREWVTTNDSA
ncbi:MAG TPA: nucleotidyl transferase AbiEii/AbiGii toxin family protein [Solirubrobacteraceae bacterium]|nr:nucleotidyl transferase AbiEii/AbiGii toxin family protein [Solirubrobacteraceae bacterium]